MSDIENRLASIENRNARVEQDKGWETSWTRRSLIMVITYICATLLLLALHNDNPFLNALVPVAGYLLSTLSLPFAKAMWLNKFFRK